MNVFARARPFGEGLGKIFILHFCINLHRTRVEYRSKRKTAENSAVSGCRKRYVKKMKIKSCTNDSDRKTIRKALPLGELPTKVG